MNLKKQKDSFIAFIILFFGLNIINTYFLTSQYLNRYISPLPRTFIGEVTAILGNFSFLLLIVLIVFIIAKKDKTKLISLLVVTSILNFAVFAFGFFNLYYGTAFATNALDIFKNPAEGISNGMFKEIMVELFVYYRIIVFLPLIVLLVYFFRFNKELKKTHEKKIFNFKPKQYLIGGLSYILIFFVSTMSFVVQLKNDDFLIGSLISTKGVQNYGVYPYYVAEFLGVDFVTNNRKTLELESDTDLINAYGEYNKNKANYKNFIDDKVYSNSLSLENSILKNTELLNLNNEDSLTGVLKDKNIVLVHLESLNYFLWEIPEIRERFHFLNKLFEESFVFENYYTSVGMGVSSDAEASVLTGLYMNGYSTFYRDYEKNNYQIDTLPKRFNELGYNSHVIHADHANFYNRDRVYLGTEDKEALIGFNNYYTIDDFAKNNSGRSFDNSKDFLKYRMEEQPLYRGKKTVSPWPSEYELADVTMDTIAADNLASKKSMVFSIFMTPHTPFMFNPFTEQAFNINNYNKMHGITKRYVEFAKYLDEVIMSYFFDIETNESKIDSNTVYVFYSDHGSSLKNGDLSILFNRDVSLLEERRMLQQTIAFIYAPSNVVDEETGINKGLLVGNQKLARGHVDLYRTIGDLFGLFTEDDIYFGVHGLSSEPTYVIDNRIQDLILDDVRKINDLDYKPYLISLRNLKKKYPKTTEVDLEQINKIKYFKRLSDLLVSDDKIYPLLKNNRALQNN
ncbi:LTA synthase family protein [Haploplasma axanthum]|uniref:Lipoteichoic acid synthase n=1 Tax=Haploplasma axanthum TaxID=29552 RepID=A0A449BBF9_HAPAX|nr:sulfatase-like hydrolase/transferase [Haploplasma axanthum]VEU79739.1 Lipoteichoic acid synthase [Haploplasma axanthum]